MLETHELDIIPRLHDNNITGNGGYNFTLVTRNMETGVLTCHHREDQPCYGELRKYKSTHGDDCTQPSDRRPSDLRHPFPPGRPEALAVGYRPAYGRSPQRRDELVNFFISDESPWKSGFISKDNVELTYSKSGFAGIILKDLTVDPTVLVNLLKIMVNTVGEHSQIGSYNKCRELGLSIKSSLWINQGIGVGNPDNYGTGSGGYGYSTPVQTNLWRYAQGVPHEFTGGTLRDRFDYNRKQMGNIFKAEEGEKGINLIQASVKALGIDTKTRVPFKTLATVMDAIFQRESAVPVLEKAA